jgi:hypothetical protein
MMTIHRMMLKTHPLLTTHVRSVHSGHSREKFPKGVAPAGLRGRLGQATVTRALFGARATSATPPSGRPVLRTCQPACQSARTRVLVRQKVANLAASPS